MSHKPIDKVGRIVIPKGIRKQLNWNQNDVLEMTTDQENESLIIKKKRDHCVVCGSKTNLYLIKEDLLICGKCLNSIIKSK